MGKITSRLRVAAVMAAVAGIVGSGGSPASAAIIEASMITPGSLSVTIDGGDQVLSCSAAGILRINGVSVKVDGAKIACDSVKTIGITWKRVASPTPTADLTRMTRLNSPNLSRIIIEADGPLNLLGSELDDLVTMSSPPLPLSDASIRMEGRGGNDFLVVSVPVKSATLLGGPGDDGLTCPSSAGTCVARGEAGNDYLAGGFGIAATVYGNEGNDVFYVKPGTTAFGGGGDDRFLSLDIGSGTWDAGAGVDSVELYGARPTTIGSPSASTLTYSRTGTTGTLHRFEQLLSHTNDAAVEVTMSPTTTIVIENIDNGPVKGDASLRIYVPGGLWTRASGQVTAPGLAPVNWSGGTTVKLLAA